MRRNVEYEKLRECIPEGKALNQCRIESRCFFLLHTCASWPNSETSTIKTACWLDAQLFGEPIDSIHQLRQDKRVFILASAAVLSTLPLRNLVFSDKAGQSPRELRCSAASWVKEKDWRWCKWRENADDEFGSLCVLKVQCWTFVDDSLGWYYQARIHY